MAYAADQEYGCDDQKKDVRRPVSQAKNRRQYRHEKADDQELNTESSVGRAKLAKERINLSGARIEALVVSLLLHFAPFMVRGPFVVADHDGSISGSETPTLGTRVRAVIERTDRTLRRCLR